MTKPSRPSWFERVSRLPRPVHYVFGVLLAAAVCARIYTSYAGTGALYNQYDDAYITYRYAINLARGHGLVFDVGEKMDAASSILYAVVLGVAYRLQLHDLERVATFLGLASVGGIVFVVFVATHDLTRRRGVAVLAAIAAGLHGFVSGWAISGMETLAFTFGVTLFVYVAFLDGRRRTASGVLLSVLVWVRVETVLLVVAWLVHVALDARREGWRRWTTPLAAVGVSAVAFIAFKQLYYGTLLPHSFELKRVWLPYAPNIDAVVKPWTDYALWVLLLGLAAITRLPRGRAAGLVVWLPLSAVSFVRGPYADWVRYTVHVLPTLCILGGYSLALLSAELPVLAIAIALLVAKQTRDSADGARTFTIGLSRDQVCRKKIGVYIREHLDPQELILSSDVGAIGYEANEFRFLDAVGLTSLDVLDVYRRGGDIGALLERRRPRFAADSLFSTTAPVTYNAARYLTHAPRFVSTKPTSLRDVSLVRDGGVLYRCSNFGVGSIGKP